MNRIVAFYSKDGNCRALAQVLADRYECELFELTEAKKRKDNFWGFMNCGREAFFNQMSKLAVDVKEKFFAYDEIVLVSPVWAGKVVPAINRALHCADISGKKVTLFICQASPDLSALPNVKKKFKTLLTNKGALYNKCYAVQGSPPGKEPFEYNRFQNFISVLLKDATV
jgi:flavodoxin